MAKICKSKGCYNVAWAKDYCRMHQYLRTDKKPTAVKKVSASRQIENKLYTPLRKKFLAEHPNCEISAPGCTGVADEVHHKEGRTGTNFLDVKKWMASCHSCNQYVEKHDNWARKNGKKSSRLKKSKKSPDKESL